MAINCKPESARSQAEDQGFRLGPRFRVLERFNCRPGLQGLAGQLGIREALAHNLSYQNTEALRIRQGQAIIESERLLV